MYMGEVKVKHHGLPSFLRTAEVLRVRGLTESSSKFKAFHSTPGDTSSIPNISNHLCQSFSNSLQSPENDLLNSNQVCFGTIKVMID